MRVWRVGAVLLIVAATIAPGVGGSGAYAASTKPRAVAITAGEVHTCALMSNETVRCWGNNEHGTLGIGRKPNQTKATPVPGLRNVTAIAAGGYRTCALIASGRVMCWGDNDYGQLGDGTHTDAFTPVFVYGITNAVALGPTCAVLATGSVKCWGDNQDGQVGDGTTDGFKPFPATVRGITNAIAITGGNQHVCALLANHTAKCWGYGRFGELGNGKTLSSRVPVTVHGLTNIVEITSGGGHTCAVLTNHTAKCLGSGPALGIGTFTNSSVPVTVKGATTFAISAAVLHTCAIVTAGGAKCWGGNEFGQLGDGTRKETRTSPVTVVGLTKAVDVAVGPSHSCALLSNGAAKCWGWNGGGRLGNGTVTRALTPVTVRGL